MYEYLGKKHTHLPCDASEEGGNLDLESARRLLHEILANDNVEALSYTETFRR
jgi:hypothetical protein